MIKTLIWLSTLYTEMGKWNGRNGEKFDMVKGYTFSETYDIFCTHILRNPVVFIYDTGLYGLNIYCMLRKINNRWLKPFHVVIDWLFEYWGIDPYRVICIYGNKSFSIQIEFWI